jgi:hypothetical protein
VANRNQKRGKAGEVRLEPKGTVRKKYEKLGNKMVFFRAPKDQNREQEWPFQLN